MSSTSTATRTVTAATPHLRAVRSVAAVPGGAERWYPSTTAAPHTTTAAAPQRTQPAPDRQPVARPAALLPAGLPEGATVVALPPSALPQGLLDRYGAELGASAGHPLVGYLLLVPADQAAPAPVPAAPAQAEEPRPAATRPPAHGISVDTDRRTAHVDGVQLDLTYLEFELLAHLTEHPHRVHTRDHLVTAVWGYGHVGDGRTVDVHVARLRRKLGAAHRDSIVTVRRVGYKYAPAV
ncbi:winged helix-turn-helix domain-containing protein [Kitasatospora sp. DSM 101779]|uniref:winged helix-turn-helix domain-containing protein n=1 Tax=Kitasatospora sp. DSM 101779 TaxID=2853165 RepID=UPI0021D92B5B|nr:winged helix-turn-helix domain-containing protein [Kitasatospora sp. DSM 101779]MCU7821826.1 winged helix-turn-helix domain-containing protein [Kitasatospora sp. DSM 101779]